MTKELNPRGPLSLGALLSRLRAYLFAGILVIAPVTITFSLITAVISFIDGQMSSLVPDEYSHFVAKIYMPGLGLIVAISFLLLVGMLTTNFLGQYFVNMGESVLNRLPIVRTVYGASKQILETVFTNQSQAFREVVLVEYPRKDMWCMGFLTGTTPGNIQDLSDDEIVNVFIPWALGPTSGLLVFVPRRDVKPVDMTVEEALKLSISAGLATPDRLKSDTVPKIKKAKKAK